MTTLLYTSTPTTQPSPPATPQTQDQKGGAPTMTTKLLISFITAALLIAATTYTGLTDPTLGPQGALALSIFILAIWAWIFSPLPDTYVSLAAAILLVLTGIIDTNTFTSSLGNSAVWLLICAVVIAQGLTASGLTRRMTAALVTRARTPRQLAHLYNIALFLTVYLVPSPSGRAALALPTYQALTHALPNRPRLLRTLGILAPSTILVSAVSSFIGAGAHLVTDEIITASGHQPIGFLHWMILGTGLGLAASILVTELCLLLFPTTDKAPRELAITPDHFQEEDTPSITGPLQRTEHIMLTILGLTVALWCTETLHGIDPVIIAALGAIATTTPNLGGIKLGPALKKAPWPMLIFMATTLAIGTALAQSGAAAWLTEAVFAPVTTLGQGAGTAFIILTIIISTIAHLVIQSRSARSAVLIPLIIAAATPLGINPVAAAFISTAAAGFCHTLTSSAKPVALFASVDGTTTYTPADLLKLSAWLAPTHAALIAVFSFTIWPALGLPLYL